jgi:hypothetical protein
MLQDLVIPTGGSAINEDLGKTTSSTMNEMRVATVVDLPDGGALGGGVTKPPEPLSRTSRFAQ